MENTPLVGHFVPVEEISDANENTKKKAEPRLECFNPLRIIGVQPQTPLAWSPDGSRMSFVSGNHSIYVTIIDGEKLFSHERVLSQHIEQIHCLLYHPTLPYLVSGGLEGFIVWNWKTGQQVFSAFTDQGKYAHKSAIECFCWMYDSSLLVSGSKDTNIKIWDVENDFKLLETVDAHKAPILAVAFNPSNDTLVTAGRDSSIRFWNVQTLSKESRELRKDDKTIKINQVGECTGHRGDVLLVRFSQKGDLLFSAARDNSVRVWDANKMSFIRSIYGHKGDITGLHIFKNDTSIISSSTDAKIKVYDLAKNPEDVAVVESHNQLDALLKDDIIPEIIAPIQNPILDANDETKDRVITSFQPHSFDVSHMEISPVANLMVTSSSECCVRAWDISFLDKPKMIHEFVGHQDRITSLKMIDGDNSFMSASSDYNCYYYDILTMRRWANVHSTGSVFSLAFGELPIPNTSDKQRLVFVGGTDYNIHGYLTNFELVCTLTGHYGKVHCLELSPRGDMLVSASADFNLYTWRLQVPFSKEAPSVISPRHKYAPHDGIVSTLAFNEKGDLLITGGSDHALILWRVKNFALHQMQIVRCSHTSYVSDVTFGSGVSSELFFSASWDGTVKMWSTSSFNKGGKRAIHKPIQCISDNKSKVTAIAISEGGNMLVSASADNSIRLYEICDGEPQTLFPDAIYSVPPADGPFSSLVSGKALFVTGSENGMIRVWPFPKDYEQLFHPYIPK